MTFSRRVLFRIVIGCGPLGSVIGSFFGLRMTESAHAQRSVSGSSDGGFASPLDAIEARAHAGSGATDQVRMLVDDALNCGIFAGSATSIRERVLRAELAFRAGKQPAISESTLVRAINDMASVAFAPEAFKTGDEQVHGFRIMVNPAMPHFVGTSNLMSPAEAVFITGFLTQQKLYIPNYTLDPQKVTDWAASRSSDQAFVDTHEPPHGTLKVSSMPREMAEVAAALREQLPHEWSLVTICVHLFLDRAGLPR